MLNSDLSAPDSDIRPTTIGFLLIPGFALLPYACAVEPLRAANILSGRRLYTWVHYSPDGEPTAASNGVVIPAGALPAEGAPHLDTLFVCAGGNPATFKDSATFARLRRLGRQGVPLGGIRAAPMSLLAPACCAATGSRCIGNTPPPSPRNSPASIYVVPCLK